MNWKNVLKYTLYILILMSIINGVLGTIAGVMTDGIGGLDNGIEYFMPILILFIYIAYKNEDEKNVKNPGVIV